MRLAFAFLNVRGHRRDFCATQTESGWPPDASSRISFLTEVGMTSASSAQSELAEVDATAELFSLIVDHHGYANCLLSARTEKSVNWVFSPSKSLLPHIPAVFTSHPKHQPRHEIAIGGLTAPFRINL